MHTDWFYMQEIPAAGAQAELDEAEARHALGSRRLEKDDAITLFDGQGVIANALIRATSRRATTVEIVTRDTIAPPRRTITLASALPKGDRQSVMLSMAAQLGMNAFVPLICERSIAQPGRSFTSRAQRIFIEACKQSRQAYLPVIEHDSTPAEVAQAARSQHATALLADPTGEPLGKLGHEANHVLLTVGPEGGFTERELQESAHAGAKRVSLGESILRTETAAVAMLAWARLTAR